MLRQEWKAWYSACRATERYMSSIKRFTFDNDGVKVQLGDWLSGETIERCRKGDARKAFNANKYWHQEYNERCERRALAGVTFSQYNVLALKSQVLYRTSVIAVLI